MKTFALFDNATNDEVVLGFWDPERGVPLKLMRINIADPDVIASASNGCWAALRVLRESGYGENYCLTYQFKEKGPTSYVLGKSAGLAFCLKFAQEVAAQET